MKEKKHLGSYAIIKKEDEIILIKKCKGPYTNTLDLPGGTIEHNENPYDTVLREVNEEVGINVYNPKLKEVISSNTIFTKDNEEINLHHIGIIFNVDFNKEDKLNEIGDGIDSKGAFFYKISELKDEELSPIAKIVINELI